MSNITYREYYSVFRPYIDHNVYRMLEESYEKKFISLSENVLLEQVQSNNELLQHLVIFLSDQASVYQCDYNSIITRCYYTVVQYAYIFDGTLSFQEALRIRFDEHTFELENILLSILQKYHYIIISLDDVLDHIFIIAIIDDEYYVIQSYLNIYSLVVYNVNEKFESIEHLFEQFIMLISSKTNFEQKNRIYMNLFLTEPNELIHFDGTHFTIQRKNAYSFMVFYPTERALKPQWNSHLYYINLRNLIFNSITKFNLMPYREYYFEQFKGIYGHIYPELANIQTSYFKDHPYVIQDIMNDLHDTLINTYRLILEQTFGTYY